MTYRGRQVGLTLASLEGVAIPLTLELTSELLGRYLDILGLRSFVFHIDYLTAIIEFPMWISLQWNIFYLIL